MAPHRSLSVVPRSGGSVAMRSTRPPVSAPKAPGLRILVAGVDKDTRGVVEASVRRALGSQAEQGPWSISVVSMAGRWSVTLDGPDERMRGLSFVADGSRLADAIREAVYGMAGAPGDVGAARVATAAATATVTAAVPATATGAAVAPATAGAAGTALEAHDRHVCKHCGKPVLVIYEQRPGEGKALAAVACPHCWVIGHVEIGAWAAAGDEYRAEKG